MYLKVFCALFADSNSYTNRDQIWWFCPTPTKFAVDNSDSGNLLVILNYLIGLVKFMELVWITPEKLEFHRFPCTIKFNFWGISFTFEAWRLFIRKVLLQEVVLNFHDYAAKNFKFKYHVCSLSLFMQIHFSPHVGLNFHERDIPLIRLWIWRMVWGMTRRCLSLWHEHVFTKF